MNSPYAPLIPTKVGIQVEQICVSLAHSLCARYRVVARYERLRET